MGNKLHSHRPERSNPSRARNVTPQKINTGGAEKISISKIPPAPISMSSTNGKDVEKILKEINKSPGFKDINKLPRDLSKSDEINKSIDLIQNKLETNSSFDGSVSSDENIKIKPEISKVNSTTANGNERKRTTVRSKSNVEDLSKKRQKLMRQIQKLNQLENEKQIKLLEQQRDLYVEQIKIQDSMIIEESLNTFRNSKDRTFSRAYDSRESDSEDSDKLPFTKIKSSTNNHSLIPLYVQETKIPRNAPIYVVPNGLRDHHTSTKSLYNFNNQESKEKREREAYYCDYYDVDKLNEKDLNLILTAIEKYEQIEKNKKQHDSNNSYRQSKYYYKDKQIYPQLDISAVADPSSLNLIYQPRQNLKQLELKKSDKLINDLKVVKDPPKVQHQSINSSNRTQQQSNSLSQVLKDIIIEYSNMSEEEFDKFKMDLNRDKVAKQVAEQQRILEQQKIPKKILDAYRNPYYEHCSYANRPEQLMSRSEVNAFRSQQSDANEMKRAQSFKAYEPSNLKRARSNLKKLASKKNGEKIAMDEDEDLYDPTNFSFDEEIKYRI